MTTKSTSGIALAIVAGLLIPAAACQKGSGIFTRNRSEQYETISEGTASGVSSTIAAPGEIAPPLAGSAPLTNTNVDTTTSLTIGTDMPMTTGTSAPADATYTPSSGGYSTPPYGTTARPSVSGQLPTGGEIHLRRSRQPDTTVQPTLTQAPPTTPAPPTTTVNTTTTGTSPSQTDTAHVRKDDKKDKKPQPEDDEGTDTAPPPPTETSDTTSAT